MTRIVRDSVEMLARLLEFFPLKIKKSCKLFAMLRRNTVKYLKAINTTLINNKDKEESNGYIQPIDTVFNIQLRQFEIRHLSNF